MVVKEAISKYLKHMSFQIVCLKQNAVGRIKSIWSLRIAKKFHFYIPDSRYGWHLDILLKIIYMHKLKLASRLQGNIKTQSKNINLQYPEWPP